MRYFIVVIAIVLALFCRAFLVSVYKVPSQTMAPAMVAGDFILAMQTSYGLKFPWSPEVYFSSQPKPGDLVAFTKGSKIFIKRVIAVSPEVVEYDGAEFTVNSKKCEYTQLEVIDDSGFGLSEEKCNDLSRKIIKPLDVTKSPKIQPIKLENTQIYVASDNRNFENNLTLAEIITPDQIIGKPVIVWMSYSSTQDFISKTLGVRWNRILTKLQ